MYSADEVCKEVGISSWTLGNWYRWERKQIESGRVEGNYLPIPERRDDLKGKPRRWSADMVKELKNFKKSIVVGRNGIYGVYSNPLYKETQKYKNSVKNVDSE